MSLLSHCSVPFRNWCLSSHCSVPFRNWCLYHLSVLFLSETGVSIVPLFCSFKFKTLVSLLSSCSVLFRNWCLYGPTVLFLSETSVYHPIILFLSETGVPVEWGWRNGESSGISVHQQTGQAAARIHPGTHTQGWCFVLYVWMGGCIWFCVCVVYVCTCTFVCTCIFFAYLWIIIFAGLSHWGCRCWPTLYLSLFSKNAWHISPLTSLLCWCHYHSSTLCMSVQQVCMACMTICKFVVLMSLPLINFMHVCFSKCRWCAWTVFHFSCQCCWSTSYCFPASANVHGLYKQLQVCLAVVAAITNQLCACLFQQTNVHGLCEQLQVCLTAVTAANQLHASLFLSRCVWTVSSLSC